MKNNFSILVCSLILMELALLQISGCRKEDKNKPETTLPAVITSPVTDIRGSFATCGGNVTSDGGSNVYAIGVCWSINDNPVISDSHTSDGSGTGNFSSSITDLIQNTTYFTRAYAKNSAGIAYGNSVQFTTISAFTEGVYHSKRDNFDYFVTISNSGNNILFKVIENGIVVVCSCNYECYGKLISDPPNGFIVEGEWYKFLKTSGPYVAPYFVVQQKDINNILIRESDVGYELAYNLGATYIYNK